MSRTGRFVRLRCGVADEDRARLSASQSRGATEEDPSAPSPASTTGSASPRSASSARTASRSASSASTTPCGWPRRPTSTWSRSRRWPARRSASSWTTASSSTSPRRRPVRRARTRRNTVIKEMKLRPKIDPHDYETKKGHVVRFLKAGRQGQDHDHVPRPRAVPPRARASGCCSGSPTDVAGARLRRVRAQAGRPQHDHGARPAQEEGRGQGRGAQAAKARAATDAERRAEARPSRRGGRRRDEPRPRPTPRPRPRPSAADDDRPGSHAPAGRARRRRHPPAHGRTHDEETRQPCRRTRRTAAPRSASR